MGSNGVLCGQGRRRGPLGKVACEQRPGVLGGVIGYGVCRGPWHGDRARAKAWWALPGE